MFNHTSSQDFFDRKTVVIPVNTHWIVVVCKIDKTILLNC